MFFKSSSGVLLHHVKLHDYSSALPEYIQIFSRNKLRYSLHESTEWNSSYRLQFFWGYIITYVYVCLNEWIVNVADIQNKLDLIVVVVSLRPQL